VNLGDVNLGDVNLGGVGLVLVAAVAENGVIGRDGGLPWRLSSDLRRFRTLTLGHPVVMGRKTHDAIGKPLPGRTNIVITRDPAFAARGVVSASNLEAALAVARGDALRRGVRHIMIIGGGELYDQTLGCACRLEITRVHARPAGDSVFPAIDAAQWRETGRCEYPAGPDDDAPFTTLAYERILA
jgi:dihydrofolate reductase